jgi:hypothetical protein
LLKPFVFVVRQAGFEPRLKSGGISLTLNLPTWYKSWRIINVKSRGLLIFPDFHNFVVRQAGFEPATYGFVVRRSIRAELLAHVKTGWNLGGT